MRLQPIQARQPLASITVQTSHEAVVQEMPLKLSSLASVPYMTSLEHGLLCLNDMPVSCMTLCCLANGNQLQKI